MLVAVSKAHGLLRGSVSLIWSAQMPGCSEELGGRICLSVHNCDIRAARGAACHCQLPSLQRAPREPLAAAATQQEGEAHCAVAGD